MKRTWSMTIVAGALALALPSAARAVEPLMTGQVTGMSDLPMSVQDTITREAQRKGAEIGELRKEPHGSFAAELKQGKGGEVITLDRTGRVEKRTEF